jgi:hypothetical protein
MIGDSDDMLARLKQVLPGRWFADNSPVLDALLGGLAAAWSGLYTLLSQVKAQARLATASGVFLDIAAQDFFWGKLPRRVGEADGAFSGRLRVNLVAPRATRAGVERVLQTLTGRVPKIFEPLNATDTGGYNVNLGYNNTGGYGSMNLPYQFFVTAYRPNDLPISNAGGYNNGPGGYGAGLLAYASAEEFAGNIGDDEIYASIAAVIPVSCIAWTNISN